MSKEIISTELLKESPDWLLISNLAKELYLSTQQTNPLGFRKGVINVVKCGEYSTWDVLEELKSCFDSGEYSITSRSTSNINTLLREYKNGGGKLKSDIDGDKYVVIVTDSSSVATNLITAGFQCNLYKATIFGKYTKKTVKMIIKGEGININVPLGGLKAEIRDAALKSLLS